MTRKWNGLCLVKEEGWVMLYGKWSKPLALAEWCNRIALFRLQSYSEAVAGGVELMSENRGDVNLISLRGVGRYVVATD
eukprot:1592230-Rhodomonas_salina.2